MCFHKFVKYFYRSFMFLAKVLYYVTYQGCDHNTIHRPSKNFSLLNFKNVFSLTKFGHKISTIFK